VIQLLHFADAHIDMANWGRHDPETGLPIRVMDFLNALDQIVEAAIERRVELVLFAGDAYKDRNPQPTFQREWGKRIMRLSQAKIPTVLLVGNHDVAPALGRAHTMQEFGTLAVPYVHLADDFMVLGPEVLGIPLQILAIPWVSRSKLMRHVSEAGKPTEEMYTDAENIVGEWVEEQLATLDPDLPTILLAHASVHGAAFSSERMVTLGQELVLSGQVVRDHRFDYVALGHIHKHQELNGGVHPPIVYPGSIERVDFGEINERKGFVLAEVSKGRTNWEFYPLRTRPYLDIQVEPKAAESFMVDVMSQLPPPARVRDAVCRVQISYPHDWEALLDEAAILQYLDQALSVQIQKQRTVERRSRLGDIAGVESLGREELLLIHWRSKGLAEEEITALQALAQELFAGREA